jgi:hypothetical protein
LEVGKDKLKFKCKYRAMLLTELSRLKHEDEKTTKMKGELGILYVPPGIKSFPVERVQRMGSRTNSVLLVFPYALVETSADGKAVLQEYKYTHIQKVGFTTDDQRGLTVYVTGRARLFMTSPNQRSDLASSIKSASENIGSPFEVGEGVLLSQWGEIRASYGKVRRRGKNRNNILLTSRRYDKFRPLTQPTSHFLSLIYAELRGVHVHFLRHQALSPSRGFGGKPPVSRYYPGVPY